MRVRTFILPKMKVRTFIFPIMRVRTFNLPIMRVRTIIMGKLKVRTLILALYPTFHLPYSPNLDGSGSAYHFWDDPHEWPPGTFILSTWLDPRHLKKSEIVRLKVESVSYAYACMHSNIHFIYMDAPILLLRCPAGPGPQCPQWIHEVTFLLFLLLSCAHHNNSRNMFWRCWYEFLSFRQTGFRDE